MAGAGSAAPAISLTHTLILVTPARSPPPLPPRRAWINAGSTHTPASWARQPALTSPSPDPARTPAAHARLLSWFLDPAAAPFGVHRVVRCLFLVLLSSSSAVHHSPFAYRTLSSPHPFPSSPSTSYPPPSAPFVPPFQCSPLSLSIFTSAPYAPSSHPRVYLSTHTPISPPTSFSHSSPPRLTPSPAPPSSPIPLIATRRGVAVVVAMTSAALAHPPPSLPPPSAFHLVPLHPIVFIMPLPLFSSLSLPGVAADVVVHDHGHMILVTFGGLFPSSSSLSLVHPSLFHRVLPPSSYRSQPSSTPSPPVASVSVATNGTLDQMEIFDVSHSLGVLLFASSAGP
ncbi:hypothetical protein B0H17DRAFT_1218194 [Mycena rosella]|uniref:Uncharacterized protein n=1 Tax=Mycena rosella TaxID=1033263 RepID=A0AAD7FND5_MYCRO|nr:hypothetical protein B0H17DRAFT_1218194 [Mycena rosella]